MSSSFLWFLSFLQSWSHMLGSMKQAMYSLSNFGVGIDAIFHFSILLLFFIRPPTLSEDLLTANGIWESVSFLFSSFSFFLLSFLSSFLFFLFQNGVSLCSADCPRTHSVDRAHRDLPAFAFHVLGLKVHATYNPVMRVSFFFLHIRYVYILQGMALH